ncbi:hypothetical protein JG687_00016715 [Phytophthora cactorum]|uniref:MULE transposase domain-containing protein n=1 Tax=Phytophthora cactorum TaxID=29920 RepID=A0A8T1TT44_9STRA|nr:hypothetical protein JG687_00016715 [Phytophthora cactorum]
MKPIIDLCARTMYDAAGNVTSSSDNVLIMCDTKYQDNALVPNLGTSSASSPFRIGLTCFTLLDKYITIQQGLGTLIMQSLTAVQLSFKILMCWFHVCQNVRDGVKRAALGPVTVDMIFRDLNSLQFVRDEQEFFFFLTKRATVRSSWRSASTFCSGFAAVANHIISQWILHPHCSCWQTYLTPAGVRQLITRLRSITRRLN